MDRRKGWGQNWDARMGLLCVRNLVKAYIDPEGKRSVVVDVASFDLDVGQHVALSGESGSGKTTFLNLIAGIIRPDSGSITLAGTELSTLSESERDRLRATSIGYIFQTFNLLQGFTALENVTLGMSFGHGVDISRARALLERVGLGSRLHHYPRQLSTGQQQRAAVARALSGKPKLVLADEPTGNLDHANAREVLQLIREVCRENDAALLLVSHDPEVLGSFGSVSRLGSINRAAANRSQEVAP